MCNVVGQTNAEATVRESSQVDYTPKGALAVHPGNRQRESAKAKTKKIQFYLYTAGLYFTYLFVGGRCCRNHRVWGCDGVTLQDIRRGF